jgi:hypothetical protein
MKEWLKAKWKWVAAGMVLVVALVVWIITRRKNGWAAEKILEIQADTEVQVQREEDKATAKTKKLDDDWQKARKKIVDERTRKIERITVKAVQLDRAKLKTEVLDDLDDPL